MEWDSKLKDFFVSNEETKLAVCNLCNKSISFKTTVINLMQHLALAHREALLNSFPVVISNEDELPDNAPIPVVISCDSWSFFETVEGSTTATCALCLKKVSFKTSHSNLKQHLKMEHAEIYKNFISSKSAPSPQNGSEGKNCEKKVENSLKHKNSSKIDNWGSEKVISELVINSEADLMLPSDDNCIIISSKPDRTKRKHTSPVWKIFDRIPNTEKATCSLCRKILSYKSTTTNLTHHIKRIHPVAYNIHFVTSKATIPQNDSEENNSDAENSHLDNNSEDEHSIENINSMFNTSKTIKKRNELWNFFDKLPNTLTAKCTLCQKIISYKSTRANLESHLKRIHAIAYQKQFILSKLETPQNSLDKESDLEDDNLDEENALESNSENEHLLADDIFNSSKTTRNNRSDIWNFFDKIPNTQMAMCTLCQKNLSYRSTATNLRDHMKRKHPVAYNLHFVSSKSTNQQNDSEENNSDTENSHVENNSEDEQNENDKMFNSSKTIRNNRSNLWNCFDKIPNTQMATCTLCQKNLSYRSTTTNLRHHLERIHPVAYNLQFVSSKSTNTQNNSEENNSDPENSHAENNSEEEHNENDSMCNSAKTIRNNRSDVWIFFEKIPNTKIATCTLCQKNLSYRSTTTNLRHHLERLHPIFYHKKFNLSQSATAQKGSEEGSSLEEINLDDENSHEENSHEKNSNEENSHVENNSENGHLLENNMLNSSKIKRRNASSLWKLFDRIPNTKTAMCTLCQKIISYRSTTAHLISHIRRIHPSVYHKNVISSKSTSTQNYSEEINLDEENSHEENSHVENNSENEHLLENTTLNSSKITRRNASSLWKLFDRIPNTKTAMCTVCQKIISYRSTTAHLISHIRRIHPSVYHKNVISSKSTSTQNHSEENNSDEENFQVEHNSEDEQAEEVEKTNRFDIWKVFDRIEKTKMAICTLCQKNMSYKSTTANLRNHIKRIHPKTYFQRSEYLNGKEDATSENENFHKENNSEEVCLHKNSMLYSPGSYKTDIKIETTREEDSQQPDRNCSEKFRQDNFSHLSKYCNRAIMNFFERNDKTKMFHCKLCQNPISYKSSIMHLKQHLKHKHKDEYPDFSSRSEPLKNIYEVYISAGEDQEPEDSREKQSTIFNSDKMNHIGRGDEEKKHIDTQMDPFDSDENIIEEPPKKIQRINSIIWANKIQPDEKKYIDRCLLKLITEDFQPLSIVEDKGFQEFIAVLNPNYQLPTQTTLSSLLTEEYTRKLAEFKEFTHNCSSISLSVDCWSSRNMQSFMTVTVHFIDQNTFEFCSVLIQSAGLHVQDTPEKIATQLRQVTSKWDILNKVKFIVFENAPKMVSAAKILNWPHFTCFANKFNSIVQEALNSESIAEIVAKVQKAVEYFKRNSVAKETLHEYQVKIQKVAQPKGLVLAIPTCWITVCKMLKRFNELREAVRATFSDIDEEISAITTVEWQCIDQLVEILKPFEEAATIMSSEKYLIAGKAVVLSAGLYKVCIDLTERNFCEPISNLILRLKNDLSTKLCDIEKNETIAVCTLLDPRFKQHAFEDHAAMLNAKECVLQKLKQLNNGHSVDSAGSSSTTTNTNTDSSLLGRFYTKVASSYHPEMTEHRTMDELNRYLSENVIPPTECSLRWWKERRMLYPGLSKIFVASSNIVVTSSPCDRAFSKSGYVLSDRLNGLTTSKVDKIMFLNVNK